MPKAKTIKPKRMTIEDLAVITGRGFDGMEKRFEGIDRKFEGIDQQFEGFNKKFERLEQKVDDGFLHINTRLDTIRGDSANVLERVEALETHTGIVRKK